MVQILKKKQKKTQNKFLSHFVKFLHNTAIKKGYYYVSPLSGSFTLLDDPLLSIVKYLRHVA